MSKAKPKRLLLLAFFIPRKAFLESKRGDDEKRLECNIKKVSFLSTYWCDAFLTDDKRVAEPCFKTLTSKKSEDFIFLHRCQKVVQQFRLVGKVMVMKEGNS